jgi:hypothetical protein
VLPLSTTLVHGLLICLPFSAFVLVSFWRWPRLWLHSLPPDIARLAGPKTPEEETQTRYLLVAFLLILPGPSLLSAVLAAEAASVDLSFVGALAHIYGIWVIVHVWDFVVIDCGYAALMDPRRPPIPGTEGAKGYKDYAFHFRMLLRAVVMSALFVVPGAAFVSLVA